MMYLLLFLALGIGIAYVLYRYFPGTVERWFYRIQAARKTVFTLGFLATMLILLISGVIFLQALGLAMVVFVGWYVFIVEPQNLLSEVIP